MTEPTPLATERLGPLADAVAAEVEKLIGANAVARIWSGDHTLWQPDPTEVTDRLGWLRVGPEVAAMAPTLDAFVTEVAAEGFTHALVMGMGGSSLFPEVVARTFPKRDNRPELRVLDTTDPAAIGRIEHECPLDTTLFVASSKSGGTVETRSHLEYFWAKVGRPEQFTVITDPGSDLQRLAEERSYRKVWANRPDIGGRYSALSYFGVVPAALAGAGYMEMLDAANRQSDQLEPDVDPRANPGLRLGAILGAAVKAGRDKVTLVIDAEVETFGLWLEQLLAESTGKHGTGVVPIAGERLGPPEVYGDDRLFVAIGEHHGLDVLAERGHPVVSLPYEGPSSIGAQVLLWEFATAVCGAVLEINAFDQPNVAEAKEATNHVLQDGLPDVHPEPLAGLLDQVKAGDYVSIQAYLDPDDGVVDAIEDARTAIRDRLAVATTFGLGPRFLHSTGQLHKGGPPTGVFVQVLGADTTDLAIPGRDYSFSTLKQAQAAGDLFTLRDHGLRAARIDLEDLLAQTR